MSTVSDDFRPDVEGLRAVAVAVVVVVVLFHARFVANIRFAVVLGDYFGAQLGELTPSPLLHFWSLAVEEQFHLVWPALMLLVARRPRQYRRLLVLGVRPLQLVGRHSYAIYLRHWPAHRVAASHWAGRCRPECCSPAGWPE